MIESLKTLMVTAGSSWIIWILGALSVLSVGTAAERAWVFWRRKDKISTLVTNLHDRLTQHDLAGADTLLQNSKSVAATVVGAGLAHWERGTTAVVEAMSAASGMERSRLERHLSILGTIGNNAPFIGLLGTVIGIVGAFEALGNSASVATAAGALAPERVMSTIAEALVTTAVGLVVAIPAVALFNYFQGLLTLTMDGADTLGHVLLSHLGTDTERRTKIDPALMRKPAANDTPHAEWNAGDSV